MQKPVIFFGEFPGWEILTFQFCDLPKFFSLCTKPDDKLLTVNYHQSLSQVVI